MRCIKLIEQHYISTIQEGMNYADSTENINRSSPFRRDIASRNILTNDSNNDIIKKKDNSNKSTQNSNLFRTSKWGSSPLLIG